MLAYFFLSTCTIILLAHSCGFTERIIVLNSQNSWNKWTITERTSIYIYTPSMKTFQYPFHSYENKLFFEIFTFKITFLVKATLKARTIKSRMLTNFSKFIIIIHIYELISGTYLFRVADIHIWLGSLPFEILYSILMCWSARDLWSIYNAREH